MMFSTMLRGAIMAALLHCAVPALAQTMAPGTYAMPESGYSIVIRPQGDDLLVNEAGKDRTYTRTGPGIYAYTSQITGATYELRYRDRGSVTAMKLGSGNTPTLLVRQGGALPEDASPPVAPVAPAAPASPFLAVAEKYQALALTDKKDVQSWAFCSAAALKRSMATKDEADAYGREAAGRLASISVDPARNPCPDAIPETLWPRPQDEEAEAAKQANAVQLAAAEKQRAEIAAMKARQDAEQKAYERARADHAASLERSRQEQAEFARQQAAYRAALAEHQRQLEARGNNVP